MKTFRKSMIIAALALVSLISFSRVHAASKEVIVVGTDSATKPFTYKDGNKDTGYDIEVLKKFLKAPKNINLKSKQWPFHQFFQVLMRVVTK